jgi:peptide/nickel transport system permease protein
MKARTASAQKRPRIAGAVTSALLLAFCVLGPLLNRHDPLALDVAHPLAAPNWMHWLGTDELGRDQLARLMQGGADTLVVAFPAAAVALALGAAYGLLAGLAPSWVDRVAMRLLDAVLALPALLVLLCGAALLPLSAVSLALLIGATGWPALARLVRTETIALRGRTYVAAARQAGGGPLYLAWRHILPEMRGLLAAQAVFLVGDSILALSALSFLGLGVPPPAASWGQMLQSGLGLVDLGDWWLILPPGGMIVASLWVAGRLARPPQAAGGKSALYQAP